MKDMFVWNTGETPDPGYYICANCQDLEEAVEVSNEQQVLPECPYCGATCWIKVQV